jgi:sugar lactone lactonase YvrE
MRHSEVSMGGLVFPEGPRWRNDELWFVDMFGHRFYRWQPSGSSEPQVVAEIPHDLPSGSGFLPDGTPLLVLRYGRQIVRVTTEGLEVHANIGPRRKCSLNDMVVDDRGRAFVGNIVRSGGDLGDECVFVVDIDGEVRVATKDVRSPNGLVIPAMGGSLVVAETLHHTLAAFDVDADGLLSGRRIVSSEIPGRPDGMCGDEEGAFWVGCVHIGEFVRVLSDGRVVDRISVGDRLALACALGGPTRTTLYMMTAATTIENVLQNEARGSQGFIEIAEVEVPGTGSP